MTFSLPGTANSHIESWGANRNIRGYTEVEARYILTLPTDKTFKDPREVRQEFYLQAELLIMKYEEIKIVFWQEPEIIIQSSMGMAQGSVKVFPLIDFGK